MLNIDQRITQLESMLRGSDYRGRDPFDLPNAPLFSWVPASWYLPTLFISKFGSRIAPDWLRSALRIPTVQDPKTYACSYFAYRALGDEYDEDARKMASRLVSLASEAEDGSGIYWGYGYTWPTMHGVVNPKGASTIVPASFAMFALIHEAFVFKNTEVLPAIEKAARYYSTNHLCRQSDGQMYLGYFTGRNVNVHNANLLGCTALTLCGAVLQIPELQKLAAEAAASSVMKIEDSGYIEYHDARSGQWTDCFHHLYVVACMQALLHVNPYIDSALYNDRITRLLSYYAETFIRSDGQLNYYPGGPYPIDPHNYAAAIVFGILQSDPESEHRSGLLIEAIDNLTWDNAHQRYVHRIHKYRTDRRYFTRWTQAWMFLALSVFKGKDTLRRQLQSYKTLNPHAASSP